MNKCDVCSKFGELEEVMITVKKHKECDINGAFGQLEPKKEISVSAGIPGQIIKELPPTQLIPEKQNEIAPYVGSELAKMIK